MNLVFIRHGKTENYDVGKRQGPDSKLGKTGQKQALKIANRLKKSNLKFDQVITSSWVRASQTAEKIAKKTGLSLSEHPMIHEYISNSILVNQPIQGELVKEYEQAVRDKGINFEWKFRGEGESLRDVINRAIAFKKELLNFHQNRNYIIVSHGLFITTF
ncbi:MAG: histidine phosphatase family protein, partial [Candidatus Amesbacteria bacterium]|nr:histidine phosphatase family protein [Candidatus Amesbacteria bacterium]